MVAGEAGADAAFTDAARARLVSAYAACALSDLARAAVPVGAHELRPDGTVESPGSVLADAARVLAAARQFLDAAVVYERVGGASWQLVGDTLGLTAGTAQARFAEAESRFRAEPCSTPEERSGVAGDELGWWRAHVARDPLEAALDLDDWVLRHQDGEDGLGAAPVSGGLLRTNPAGSRPSRLDG